MHKLKVLNKEMKNSIKGINNLKITYREDSLIFSRFEIITENIERQIGTNDLKIDLLEKDLLPMHVHVSLPPPQNLI